MTILRRCVASCFVLFQLAGCVGGDIGARSLQEDRDLLLFVESEPDGALTTSVALNWGTDACVPLNQDVLAVTVQDAMVDMIVVNDTNCAAASGKTSFPRSELNPDGLAVTIDDGTGPAVAKTPPLVVHGISFETEGPLATDSLFVARYLGGDLSGDDAHVSIELTSFGDDEPRVTFNETDERVSIEGDSIELRWPTMPETFVSPITIQVYVQGDLEAVQCPFKSCITTHLESAKQEYELVPRADE